MTSRSKLPSPAMAVAFTALFLVLGGSAVALNGKNSVDSGDIKNGQISTADIRNSGVRGTDVRPNTLTGTDINESTLGKVASAETADSAKTADTATSAGRATSAGTATTAGTATSASTVGGLRMQKFYLEENEAGPPVAPIVVGGVRITPDCPGGKPNFDAANGTSLGAQIFANGGCSPGLQQFSQSDENFTSGDNFDLSAARSDTGNGTAVADLRPTTRRRRCTTAGTGIGTITPTACAIFGYAAIG